MLIAIDFRNPKWLVFIVITLNRFSIDAESIAANQRTEATAKIHIVSIVHPGIHLLSCEREDRAFWIDNVTPAVLPTNWANSSNEYIVDILSQDQQGPLVVAQCMEFIIGKAISWAFEQVLEAALVSEPLFNNWLQKL